MGIKADENAMVTAVMPLFMFTPSRCVDRHLKNTSLSNSTLHSIPVTNTT